MTAAVLTSVVTGPLAAAATTERASGARSAHWVTFTRTRNQPLEPGQGPCVPDGRCIGTLTAHDALAGDITGTVTGVSALTGDPVTQIGAGAGVGIWSITDSPCGHGTLIVLGSSFGEASSLSGKWRIATAQGTEDLAEASGSGRFSNTPAGVVYEGRLHCTAHN